MPFDQGITYILWINGASVGYGDILMQFAVVALGGAAGSVLRYGITRLFPFIKPILWGVFAVNLIGCFMICFLFFTFTDMTEILGLLIFTGFFGGFTTMSSVSLEMANHWKEKPMRSFAVFIMCAAVCIGAGFLGRGLALIL